VSILVCGGIDCLPSSMFSRISVLLLFLSSYFHQPIECAITESYTRLHKCHEEPKLNEIVPKENEKRILIMIPFYMTEEAHDHKHPNHAGYYQELSLVLDSFLTYENWEVDIIIDSNSKTAITKISTLYPRSKLPPGKAIMYQHWTREDFIQLTKRENAMFPKNFNEFHLLLSHVHRLYLHHYFENYKYFMYTEHDMVLTNASFELYTQRYQELWNMNWLYAFYRYDIKTSTGEKMIEILDSVTNTPAYITPSGHKYAWARWTSYTGQWILDYEQIQNFRRTPYYASGSYGKEYQYNLSPRERVAFGYHYGDFNNSFFARTLIPLIEDTSSGKKKILLDPLAGIHHSSNKYVNQLKYNEQDGEGYRWDNFDNIVTPLPCLENTRPDFIEKNDLS
jgi:hypothetical protein